MRPRGQASERALVSGRDVSATLAPACDGDGSARGGREVGRWVASVALMCGVLVGCSMSGALLPTSARVLGPQPAVGWGSGGVRVRLDAADGMRFLAPVRVTFDGVAAEVGPVGTEGFGIVVVTPPHASGAVDVRVVVAADTPYERRFTLPAAFTYVPSGRVESTEPSFARDDGGTVVRVLGSGFQREIVAAADGAPAELERVSSGEVLVTMPAHSAGVAELSLTNMPGSSIEDALPPTPVTYLARDYRYHLMVSTRLVDVASGVILDARLHHGSRPVSSPVDLAEEALVGSLVGEFAALAPLRLVDRDRDTVWVGDASPGDPTASERAALNALVETLTGRGYAAERRSPPDTVATNPGPFAFYQAPALYAAGAPSDVVDAKALTVRVLIAQVIDRRHRRIFPDAPRTSAEEWAATLPARFEELSALAASTPVNTQASTVMVARSPVDRIEGAPTAWDYVTEDAIVAGLSSRLRVIDKTNGPLVRPEWAMSGGLGLQDGLAYTSWGEFRQANGQVESLLLYRPDASGFYGRLVDTATGVVTWSARALPAAAIFSGSAGETAYDRAESLLETQPWYTWIPDGARVALTARRPAGASADAWRRDAILAQDGLISALTRAGVVVAEPMVALYEEGRVPPDRTQHAEPAHLADRWQETRLAGATHVLEFEVDPGSEASPMAWSFELRSAADGSVVARFSAAEEEVEARRVLP